VLAGLDTVTSAIGMAMMYLATREDLRRHLIARPDEVRVFVEEMIRLEPGPPIVPRVVTRDVTIGDVTLNRATRSGCASPRSTATMPTPFRPMHW
jgi:cytochrome P450